MRVLKYVAVSTASMTVWVLVSPWHNDKTIQDTYARRQLVSPSPVSCGLSPIPRGDSLCPNKTDGSQGSQGQGEFSSRRSHLCVRFQTVGKHLDP